MKLSFERINLRKKFLLLSSIVMVLFALVLSGVYYRYMKEIVVQDALEKSQLILQEVEAIRSYVIEELRPRMYGLHGEESFILEAMSTTYISMRIMQLFQEKMAGYTYRRVSQNPRNPENSSNEWEDDMFDWFAADRDRSFWQGQIGSEQGASFTSIVPDYMGKECLLCHGDPQDAPRSMIDQYGDFGGFRFVEGDLAGLNSISIPITQPLSRLTRLTGIIFIVTLGCSLVLLLVVNILFDKLVVTRLARVLDSLQDTPHTFHRPGQERQKEQTRQALQNPTADELDSLQASFRSLTRYVRTARRGDNLQPSFIGPYAIVKPVTTGAMSWLYQGVHSENRSEVLLKIPFNNLYVNPLYRACLQTELKILQRCNHKNLLGIKERINDILVAAPLPGGQFMEDKRYSDQDEEAVVFMQIFELLAYLHVHEIVHHDLRPGNFFITPELSPVLIDMGLANWQKLPDTIFAAGIGPQGDFRYMAPEQINGLRGDPRSDLYSLGVMLFFAYAGEFPHRGQPDSLQAWLKAKKNIENSIMQHKNIPKALLPIFKKALAYDAAARYQWVEDMRDDFTACCQ